jgi:tRNA(Ile2) C34 agmatinyltransferase TiaS
MVFYVGMDDTDNRESRGTGRLARAVAADLGRDFPVLGVVRHQLFFDPRIPYTSHNSSAVIVLNGEPPLDLSGVCNRVEDLMLADYQVGSDPGLCVAAAVAAAVTDFGRRAKTEVVTQEEARQLALRHQILLEGLGGSEDGVIGALAGVGLAASGEDGRYVAVGALRDLTGLQPVAQILAAGVTQVQTLDGQPVTDGLIAADKLRPARRGGQPIAYVAWEDDHWQPLKLD